MTKSFIFYARNAATLSPVSALLVQCPLRLLLPHVLLSVRNCPLGWVCLALGCEVRLEARILCRQSLSFSRVDSGVTIYLQFPRQILSYLYANSQ